MQPKTVVSLWIAYVSLLITVGYGAVTNVGNPNYGQAVQVDWTTESNNSMVVSNSGRFVVNSGETRIQGNNLILVNRVPYSLGALAYLPGAETCRWQANGCLVMEKRMISLRIQTGNGRRNPTGTTSWHFSPPLPFKLATPTGAGGLCRPPWHARRSISQLGRPVHRSNWR